MTKTRKLRARKGEQGFTLVELSIVLVIIGLIVGGVLVGQELIKGAQIRALLSQLERYNSATNTFRNKFGYMPGDVPNAQTAVLGLAQSPTSTVGNGNLMLEGAAGDGDGERALFWQHLSQVSMIEGQFNGNTTIAAAGGGVVDLNGTYPPAKAGTGGIGVYTDNSFNYYHIGINSATANDAYNFANALTQQESYEIDRKIDDGMPLTGIVRAVNGLDTAPTVTGECIDDTDSSGNHVFDQADNYNMLTTSANAGQRLCQLEVRMQ